MATDVDPAPESPESSRLVSPGSASGDVPTELDGSSRVRGADLGWSSTGRGPLVLFAHGLGGDRWALEREGMLDWSAISNAGRRLVRFDARGHGTSTGGEDPTNADHYTWAELARDLLDLAGDIDEANGPIDAIGASMGTGTLLHAAVQAPHRFRRLVLSVPPTAWQSRQALAGTYEEAAILVERAGRKAFESTLAQRSVPRVFANLTSYPSRIDVTEALLPSVLRGAALSDLPPLATLATLKVPTLLLAWDGDPVHPLSTAWELAETLPSARLHVAYTPEQLSTWGRVAVAFLNE
jgi:3-oxoadipate enol-lactonase